MPVGMKSHSMMRTTLNSVRQQRHQSPPFAQFVRPPGAVSGFAIKVLAFASNAGAGCVVRSFAIRTGLLTLIKESYEAK